MILDLFKKYRDKIISDNQKRGCGRRIVATIEQNDTNNKKDENAECSKINLRKEDVDRKKDSYVKLTRGKDYIINIVSDIIDIEVKSTEGEDVKAYIENIEKLKNKDDFKFKVSENNGIISIVLKSRKNNGINCYVVQSSNIAKLVVLLPSIVEYSDLTITSTVSDVNVENISLKNGVEVSISTGDIELKEIKTKNIDMKTSSGDILLKSIECEDSITNSSSGNIEIVYSTMNYIGAKTMSGDVKVKEVCGEDLKLKSMSGDIKVNSIECKKVDLSTMNGDIFLNNKAKLNYEIERLKVNTMSGDKKVIANYSY